MSEIKTANTACMHGHLELEGFPNKDKSMHMPPVSNSSKLGQGVEHSSCECCSLVCKGSLGVRGRYNGVAHDNARWNIFSAYASSMQGGGDRFMPSVVPAYASSMQGVDRFMPSVVDQA